MLYILDGASILSFHHCKSHAIDYQSKLNNGNAESALKKACLTVCVRSNPNT